MGNRALITTRENYEKDGIAVYVHWNGGYDSVRAFLKYCELKGYRAPDEDCYGWARLCQVIGNFFGGGLSVGIDNFSKDAGEWQDNGTYIIKGWKIVGREHYDYEEQNNYNIDDMLREIDKRMPEKERLGEFLDAEEIPIEYVKVGDKVFFFDDIYNKYEKKIVMGIGTEECNAWNTTIGIPYVDKYGDEEKGYAWNINNYLKGKTVRVCR
jgi:hypothetical protein